MDARQYMAGGGTIHAHRYMLRRVMWVTSGMQLIRIGARMVPIPTLV